MVKRVLVVETSPRVRGNSNRMAEEFARGAREAGNDVDVISLAGRKVSFCVGCWGCKDSHRCVIHDDADEIVQCIRQSDVVAFATPIYYYEMCGQMKVLLDRANALYFAPNNRFHDVYLLATAESEKPDAADNAINGLRGWISCFEQARLAGTLLIGGTTTDGSIDGRPELEECAKLGRAV